jgi:hypothetical protein
MLSLTQLDMHRFIIMLGRVDVQSTTGRNLATFDTGCVNELGLLSEVSCQRSYTPCIPSHAGIEWKSFKS